MNVLYDLFPAHVGVAPATFTDPIVSHPNNNDYYYVATARVIVTDVRIVVAVDSPTGPQIVFNEPYSSFEKSEKQVQDSYVTTESGKRLAFAKDESCGCGSRLRGWNPYKTLNSIKDN